MEEDGRRWKKMDEQKIRKKLNNKKNKSCWGWSGDLSWGTNRFRPGYDQFFSELNGLVTDRFVLIQLSFQEHF